MITVGNQDRQVQTYYRMTDFQCSKLGELILECIALACFSALIAQARNTNFVHIMPVKRVLLLTFPVSGQGRQFPLHWETY